MTTYTNIGSVRGSCGHTHRTVSGAIRCLDRDQSGCAGQGGYSDRVIKDSDGNVVPTTTDDSGRTIVDENPGYGEEESLR